MRKDIKNISNELIRKAIEILKVKFNSGKLSREDKIWLFGKLKIKEFATTTIFNAVPGSDSMFQDRLIQLIDLEEFLRNQAMNEKSMITPELYIQIISSNTISLLEYFCRSIEAWKMGLDMSSDEALLDYNTNTLKSKILNRDFFRKLKIVIGDSDDAKNPFGHMNKIRNSNVHGNYLPNPAPGIFYEIFKVCTFLFDSLYVTITGKVRKDANDKTLFFLDKEFEKIGLPVSYIPTKNDKETKDDN